MWALSGKTHPVSGDAEYEFKSVINLHQNINAIFKRVRIIIMDYFSYL